MPFWGRWTPTVDNEYNNNKDNDNEDNNNKNNDNKDTIQVGYKLFQFNLADLSNICILIPDITDMF